MGNLQLAFNLSFEDLYARDGLAKLDKAFVESLAEANTDLHNQFVTARANHAEMEEKELSNLLIELAPHVEDFVSTLFGNEKEVKALQEKHNALAPIYSCKRLFVQRRALKLAKKDEAEAANGEEVAKQLEELFGEQLFELTFSKHVNDWLEDPEANDDKLKLAATYALWATHSEAGKAKHKAGVLFKNPQKLNFQHLVPVETEERDGVTMLKLPDSHLHQRDGFGLTDKGTSLEFAMDQANYCIYCHNQGKDSCSKGMREKPDAETGKAPFKKSPHNVTLNGCPLEEKISEMNTLKAQGYNVGALGVVVIDNPMCAGTGHRICNDCMKACIYQKQNPVDIPQVETRTLRDVLELPYGFEIYSLFTRWNPLNLERPLPKEDTGKKVLVAGLGPAGFTLAHHLMNDGHTVVAVDGLKIEPVDEHISGITQLGERVPFEPIETLDTIWENLDERVLAGFGGVAEYGITVRWDKNFLKVIRLLLERRTQFRMYGGVRFGSTLTYENAFAMGFDHIALAIGAGSPTLISMPNALARGVRTASDFLMALQLTGAAKKNSIANLQIRLPAVVIGGGLTGIDTTTEALAYYPIQVEKFLSRHEELVAERGEKAVRYNWSEEETEIAEEFITHAKAIREEKALAEKEGREADVLSLLQSWGGSTLAYRRNFVDAPSYRLNHEEVDLAMEEGIYFLENATPIGVHIDKYGHAEALDVKLVKEVDGEEVVEEKRIPARTIFMAAGTNPNTILQREAPEHFGLDGKYFQAIDEGGNPVSPEWVAKPETPQMFISKKDDNRMVSFFGDLHPSYAGNVVKAMGSAKQGYPYVSNVLAKTAPANNSSPQDFFNSIDQQLLAVVHEVIRLTPTIVEIVLKAPLAAEQFRPGQFYRLQNYEANALQANGTVLGMEGIALTGAWVDTEKGLLSTIVLEMGGSSDLCTHLKPGEPVILMGPTGTPTKIPENKTVMLVGGGLGNAVLFSIGKAMREAGSKVLYFAGYKKMADRYKIKEIEEASDVIIWACDEGSFEPERPQDKSFHGNIVQAMVAYAQGDLGNASIDMKDVSDIVAIGSDRMMAAVATARHNELKPHLNPEHEAIGSINSPMQCMMKEICAQCLQKHIDPATGEETFVYSCFNQDQPLDSVSFPHLNDRLKQNSIQEKLTAQWLDHCLKKLNLREEAA